MHDFLHRPQTAEHFLCLVVDIRPRGLGFKRFLRYATSGTTLLPRFISSLFFILPVLPVFVGLWPVYFFAVIFVGTGDGRDGD